MQIIAVVKQHSGTHMKALERKPIQMRFARSQRQRAVVIDSIGGEIVSHTQEVESAAHIEVTRDRHGNFAANSQKPNLHANSHAGPASAGA